MKTTVYSTLLLSTILGGCASAPELQIRYFAPRALTAINVTQNLDCSTDKIRLLISHTPSVTTTYASDRSRSYVLDTAPLRSAWANTEMAVELTDDGRLSSINHTATGQGEGIVKALLEFAAVSPTPSGGAAPAVAADTCAKLNALNGGKAATIVYEGSIDHSAAPTLRQVTLLPNAASKATYSALSGNLPVLTFEVAPQPAGQPVVVPAADTVAAWVTLTTAAPVELTFKVDNEGVWSGSTLVPSRETFRVPIPSPKPFGKQAFVLTLHSSGAIQKMSYNAETGIPAAANAATAVASFGATSDTAATAALKAQADQIAAAQRLANCQAKPGDCK